MSALAGDVLAVDRFGAWRIVATAAGTPVTDSRAGGQGMSADYVIIDEAYTFDLDAGRFDGLVAHALTRKARRS